jgi:TetR/AcrR family transcriptional regulator, lmrAB and yxaGH operons repressor
MKFSSCMGSSFPLAVRIPYWTNHHISVMPATTTEKGQRTRRRMLKAASELFRRQGYDGTGLSEVLAESGAPRGSLYFHFPGGKDQLAAEAVDATGARIGKGIEALLASSEDVGEAVGRVVDSMAADLEESGYVRGCPIAAVTLDSASASKHVREACRRSFDRWLSLLEARLRDSGWSARDAREEAIMILAAVEGALTLARSSRDPEPLRTAARRLRRDLSRTPAA